MKEEVIYENNGGVSKCTVEFDGEIYVIKQDSDYASQAVYLYEDEIDSIIAFVAKCKEESAGN